MSHVRVRFAPSPTGHLHVGSLRTALYCYLFAKKERGAFVLRIEDTDQKRFVPGAVESLIRMLQHMGVRYTEGPFEKSACTETHTTSRESTTYPSVIEVGEYGPYIQSERLAIYKKHVNILIEQKKAYHCFCTAERLDAMRTELAHNKQAPKYDRHCLGLSLAEKTKKLEDGVPYVIRFLIPDNQEIAFTDVVRGDVAFQTKDIDDPIILKSDGFPTYHLAVVVDDHLMQITHVLRSEEWLPSTPKHILLYQAFGWKVPHIGHLSVILGKDGKKKLSKRDGDVSVDNFLSQGYLKEALINFIAFLGWNPGRGNTQEIFSLAELEECFTLSGLHRAGAVFDMKKLDWMNGEYIKRLSLDDLYKRVVEFGTFKNEFFQTVPVERKTEAYLKKVLAIEHDRLVRLTEVASQNSFFFADIHYDASLLAWKENSVSVTREALLKARDLVSLFDPATWNSVSLIEERFLATAGDKRGDFLWPLRVALTGASRSPSPAQVAWVLGRDMTLDRLKQAIAKLAQ